MADVKDLFNQGEDVTSLFQQGETVGQEMQPTEYYYEPEDKSQTSALSALGAGIQRGATFGFKDEIGALAGALGAVQGGDTRGFWDIYKNIKETLKQEEAQIEEAQPMASLAGEIAGGLIVPVPAVGAVSKGMSKAIPVIGETASKAIVGGATAGALSSLGTSEADLTSGNIEDYTQATKDVAGGALLGGAIGGTMAGISKGVKKATEFVSELPYIKDTIDVAKYAAKGHEIVGQSKKINEESRVIAHNILNELETLRNETGKALGEARADYTKIVGEVPIKDKFAEIKQRIASIKPQSKLQEDEINQIKDVLSRVLDEQEKITYKYIPKPELPKTPKMSAAEKTQTKVAQKVAEAEAKDAIKLRELEDALLEAKYNGDDEAIENIYQQIFKIKQRATEYPPEVIPEQLTGLDVLGVARGVETQPIVAAIPKELPAPEATFTPLTKLVTKEAPVAQKLTASIEDLSKMKRTLNELLTKSETFEARSNLQNILKEITDLETQAAMAKGPQGEAILQRIEQIKKPFREIRTLQETLGAPRFATDLSEKQKQGLIDELQRTILSSTESKVSSARHAEFLRNLEKTNPELAQKIKSTTEDVSRRFDLAQTSEAQSLEGVKRGGLALPAMMLKGGESVGKNIIKPFKEKAPAVTEALNKPSMWVYNASPKQLQAFMDYSLGKGNTHITNTLKQLTLPTTSQSKRKAILYTLMQQPEFRQMANEVVEYLPGVGNETEE